MSDQVPRASMTDVERGMLDVMRHLQDRWAESLGNIMEHAIKMREEMGGQIAALTRQIHELSEEIKGLREQIAKDRLF
jgi:hypothetical protein